MRRLWRRGHRRDEMMQHRSENDCRHAIEFQSKRLLKSASRTCLLHPGRLADDNDPNRGIKPMRNHQIEIR